MFQVKIMREKMSHIVFQLIQTYHVDEGVFTNWKGNTLWYLEYKSNSIVLIGKTKTKQEKQQVYV